MNARIWKGKPWYGKQTSMHMQLLISKDGIPVEFGFVPGSEHDGQSLKKRPMELPAESEVFADAASPIKRLKTC